MFVVSGLAHGARWGVQLAALGLTSNPVSPCQALAASTCRENLKTAPSGTLMVGTSRPTYSS